VLERGAAIEALHEVVAARPASSGRRWAARDVCHEIHSPVGPRQSPLIRTMLADVSLTLLSAGEERAFMRARRRSAQRPPGSLRVSAQRRGEALTDRHDLQATAPSMWRPRVKARSSRSIPRPCAIERRTFRMAGRGAWQVPRRSHHGRLSRALVRHPTRHRGAWSRRQDLFRCSTRIAAPGSRPTGSLKWPCGAPRLRLR